MVRPEDLSFKTLCDFFEATASVRGAKRKSLLLRSLLSKNLDHERSDAFAVLRLVLPKRDSRRGNYDLQESKLAQLLCKACSSDPKVHSNAQRALDWKLPTTKHSGDFPAVMEEYLFRQNCSKRSNTEGEMCLKIGIVNQKLDELVTARGEDKANILAWLIRNTSPKLMKWIVHIILKDLKIGISESLLFREYHPDAESLFNISMDFKRVLVELRDRNYRLKKNDIEPGQPVRPQLASAVHGPKEAFQRLRGAPFVIETKFDGERMQIHKLKDKVFYYSRNANEHGEQFGYQIFDDVIKEQVKPDVCVLDGELAIWNNSKKVFEAFGGLKSAFLYANGAKPEENPNSLDSSIIAESSGSPTIQEINNPAELSIVYIAFDILHDGEQEVMHHIVSPAMMLQSVIDQPLQERYRLLEKYVAKAPALGIKLGDSPIKGSVIPMMPQQVFIDGTNCCRLSYNEEDIQTAYEDAFRLQEEGIVMKLLSSPWRANDRSNNWLKLKPDYAHQSEIDAVIIGGYYGTGRRAGDISEYLLALADANSQRHSVTEFVSFCRVGTGVSQKEREAIEDKLSANIVPAKAENRPSMYRVTGSVKERPDVWVVDPFSSVVLEVAADVRLITSASFATHHSLRFPRVQRVRWDKGAVDIQSQQDLWEKLDQARAGSGKLLSGLQQKRKRKEGVKKPNSGWTCSALGIVQSVDVSGVEARSELLKDTRMMVISYGFGSKSQDSIATLVAQHGGQLHLNMSPLITHYLTESKNHWQVDVCIRNSYDVLTLDWLLEVIENSAMLQPRPCHYISISPERKAQNADMDSVGDLYYEDSSPADVKVLLREHMKDVPTQVAGSKKRCHKTPEQPSFTCQLSRTLQGSWPPKTCFRGLDFCIMTVDPTSMVTHADRRRLDAEANLLQQMVNLCGGRASAYIKESTTHFVLLAIATESLECPTEVMEHMVKVIAGEQHQNILKRLSAHSCQIVTQSLVENAVACWKDNVQADMSTNVLKLPISALSR